MTIHSLHGKAPVVDPSAWVSLAAKVIGDVEIGAGSSVWPGAVIRGDFGPIRIGANTHIEDNAVLHCGPSRLQVGDHILVGHGAIVHCGEVGSFSLVGNGAILLDEAVIGEYCTIAAGTVVLGGGKVPDGSFVAGVPAIVRPGSESQRAQRHAQGSTEAGYGPLLKTYRDAGL